MHLVPYVPVGSHVAVHGDPGLAVTQVQGVPVRVAVPVADPAEGDDQHPLGVGDLGEQAPHRLGVVAAGRCRQVFHGGAVVAQDRGERGVTFEQPLGEQHGGCSVHPLRRGVGVDVQRDGGRAGEQILLRPARVVHRRALGTQLRGDGVRRSVVVRGLAHRLEAEPRHEQCTVEPDGVLERPAGARVHRAHRVLGEQVLQPRGLDGAVAAGGRDQGCHRGGGQLDGGVAGDSEVVLRFPQRVRDELGGGVGHRGGAGVGGDVFGCGGDCGVGGWFRGELGGGVGLFGCGVLRLAGVLSLDGVVVSVVLVGGHDACLRLACNRLDDACGGRFVGATERRCLVYLTYR